MKAKVTMELAQRFNNKEYSAFEELFNLAFHEMYTLSASITKDWHDSEDVTLRAFLKLWYFNTAVKDANHLKGLLCTIVKNESVNYLHSRENKLKKINKELPSDIEISEDNNHQIEFKKERINKMYEFLKELPPVCRATMEMRLIGLNSTQIAQRLNITSTAVRSHHYVGIAKLKELFKIKR